MGAVMQVIENTDRLDAIDSINREAESGEAIAVLLLGDDVFEELSKNLLQSIVYDLQRKFQQIGVEARKL